MTFKNLIEPQNVESGVAEKLLVAPVSFFTEGGIQSPTPPYLFDGSEVVIFDDHIFLPGKAWIEIALPPGKNELNAKSIGDTGFVKFAQEIKCVIAGSYAVQHELIKNLLNIPLIALIKDSNCPANMYYQLGTSCVHAYLSTDFSTGTTKEGIKGYSARISANGEYVQLYQGSTESLKQYLITEDGEFILTEDDLKIEIE
jgi:hypothetical protein